MGSKVQNAYNSASIQKYLQDDLKGGITLNEMRELYDDEMATMVSLYETTWDHDAREINVEHNDIGDLSDAYTKLEGTKGIKTSDLAVLSILSGCGLGLASAFMETDYNMVMDTFMSLANLGFGVYAGEKAAEGIIKKGAASKANDFSEAFLNRVEEEGMLDYELKMAENVI